MDDESWIETTATFRVVVRRVDGGPEDRSAMRSAAVETLFEIDEMEFPPIEDDDGKFEVELYFDHLGD